MKWKAGNPRTARHYAFATAACGLITALTLPLLGLVDLANIILLFVLAVVIVATLLGRGPAMLASFLAVASFDFFFVPPRFSFTVEQSQYLITFAVMLVVSLIISHLTDAYRKKAIEAEQRAGESALLHELASELSGALTMEQVAERLDSVFEHRLCAMATLFVPSPDESLKPVLPDTHPVNLAEQLVAEGVYLSGHGTQANPELHDSVVTTLQPLKGLTRPRGVLALHFKQDQEALETTLLLAIAAVVTTAVERIHFVEVAQTSTIEMQTERLRSSILSAISHDMRTPLTVLYGLADSLAHSPGLSGEQQATAATLRDQSYRLHRMVDNLLDMARLKSGRIVLKRDWQSIAELVGASVQALSPWLDAQRLRFEWPADLPLIEIDALLMERVFCNLLENAVKYSPAQSAVTIGARVADDKPGQRLQLWFDNAGEGFPPGLGSKVFDLFERGSTESPVPGVGVGLAVCRAIVEAHGGTITALNHSDGARVLIELPLGATPLIPEEPPRDT